MKRANRGRAPQRGRRRAKGPSGRTSWLVALVLLAVAGAVAIGVLALTGGTAATPTPDYVDAVRQDGEPASIVGDAAPTMAEVQPATLAGRSVLASTAPGAEAATTRWSATVVEAENGAPVEGALVTIEIGATTVNATSAGDGQVELDWPGASTGRLLVEHDEFVDLRRAGVESSAELTIPLRRSGAIEGRLEGLDAPPDQPIPVNLWSYARSRYRGDPEVTVEADDSGTFRFGDLDPGEYAVATHAPGSSLAFEPGLVVRSGETTQVTLDGGAAGSIRGRLVLYRSSDPVGGARVEILPERQGLGNDVEGLAADETTTQGDGSFQFDGVTTGRVEVEAFTPWAARVRADVDVADTVAERTIQVAAPGSLSGVVREASGEAAVGATVAVAVENLSRRWDWDAGVPEEAALEGRVLSTVTGDDGSFEFEAVPSSDRLLVAALPPPGAPDMPVFDRTIRLREREARGGVTLTFPDGAYVAGKVTDAEELPLAGVEVTVRVLTGASWSEWDGGETDDAGLFRVGPMPTGRAWLGFEREGYLRESLRVTAKIEDQEVYEVALEASFAFAGSVVDEAGFAVPGARITARSQPSTEHPREVRRYAEADEYGTYSFDSLFAGEWSLEPRATGWVSTEPERPVVLVPDDSFHEFTMKLSPLLGRASVTGELALRATGATVPGVRFDGLRTGAVDFDGTRFRISGIRPGRLRLIAKASGFETVYFDPVELSAGVELDVGRRETRAVSYVDVRVVDGKKRPVLGAKVQLDVLPKGKGGYGHGRSLRFRSEDKGRYRHRAVPRYAWRLRVQAEGKRTYTKVIRVGKARETVQVTLQAPKAKK